MTNELRETLKALAMLAVGCGVFLGLVLAINWLLPPAPRQITVTVHFDQPITVQLVPPRK